MPEFKLPRLQRTAPVVESDGKPHRWFQQWWQSVVERIEQAIFDLAETIARVATVEADVSELRERDLTAGDGLTGGGDLTADRTFAVGEGEGISVTADAVGLDTANNRNVDHAAVEIIAGDGLTGGGDLTADRTLDLEVPTAFGTYTPTLTAVANVSASTAYACQYLQVGDTVSVSGKVDVTATAGSAATHLGVSLPVPSAFSASEQCAGTAFCSAVFGLGAAIEADASNDRASIRYMSSDTSSRTLFFSFIYQVV